MSTDPVVMALRAALAASDAAELRVALGRRLLELGQPVEALRELEHAIALEPTHREALEAAARAADAAGDPARASAYRLAAGGAAPATAPGSGASQGTRGRPMADDAAEAPARLRLVKDDEAPAAEARPAVTFADVGG